MRVLSELRPLDLVQTDRPKFRGRNVRPPNFERLVLLFLEADFCSAQFAAFYDIYKFCALLHRSKLEVIGK